MHRAYPPVYETTGSSPEQAAAEIAVAERNRLGIGDGPISNLRDRIESDVGLRVFYFAMPPKVSGVFAYNDVLGGCVGINSNHPRDRRNWSLAHEYGHFLTTRYRAEVTFLSERKRQSAHERFADTFAENFLMPVSGLNRRFTEMHRSGPGGQITLAQLCTLADLYQVSVQALILRLEKLKRLPSGTWDRLESEGFKPRKAQQLLGINANPAERFLLSQRYLNLAVMAYVKELLSEEQLTRLVRKEAVYLRTDDPNSPLELVSLTSVEAGLLAVCDVAGSEEMGLYVDYASELDDGEAMSLAIALSRDFILATDERKA